MVLPDRLANASITLVEVERPHRVTLLNCTAHLEGHFQFAAVGVDALPHHRRL